MRLPCPMTHRRTRLFPKHAPSLQRAQTRLRLLGNLGFGGVELLGRITFWAHRPLRASLIVSRLRRSRSFSFAHGLSNADLAHADTRAADYHFARSVLLADTTDDP